MPLIEPGRGAPPFALPDQRGRVRTLDEFRGRPLVMFFYPKDLTGACAAEACAFNAAATKLRRSKAAVVGVSILGVASKSRFAAREGLAFPLLADDRLDAAGNPDPEVSRAYGVWAEKTLFGRRYMGIVRTTYLIDAGGVVAHRWDAVRVPGHAEAVLAAVRELG
jgi:peroxiredoxin Q/BCP